MKWKNSFKKGSLAAFVTLALTGSAWAMPTGGVVEQGNVNVDAANIAANDPIASVASGATITPQTNSIINWETFNIAQGEALHFNTTNAALLNRVTGAQMSELLGQMTQVGGNFLYLVNPNGIHIGGTASFDVSNLTLSTLNVASEDFLSYVTAAKPYLPSQQDAAKGAKAITVDQGAHFNAAGPLTLQASKVTVADGVTFVATPSPMPHAFYITAAKSISGSDNTTKTEAGNDVVFRGETKNFDIISMLGSNITLDGAKVAGKNINMDAVGTFTMNPVVSEDSYTMTAAPTNTLTVKNTQIAGDEVELRGGKVDVANDVKFGFDAGSNEAHLMVAAVKSYSKNNKDNKETMEASTEQGNDVAFHATVESHADRDAEVNIGGATVNLDRATFRMPKGNLSAVAIASSEDSNAEVDHVRTEKAVTKATAANALQADGMTIEGDHTRTNIYAGSVDLKNTTINTSGDVEIEAYSSREWNMQAGTPPVPDKVTTTLTAAPTNMLTLKNTQITGDKATMFGGKVDVADDVKFRFNADNHDAELTVAAVKSYFDDNQGSYKVATEQGNDVSFHGTVESGGNYRTDMGIGGATVNLDRAKFHTPNGELSVNAVQSSEDKADGTWEDTATSANVVQADGLEIVGNRNDTEFWGGKVELKNTTIKTPGEVQVYAYNTMKEDGSKTEDVTAGADNVVQLTNTKILNEGSDPQSYSNLWIRGGKIEMNDSELASEDEIRLEAFNSLHEVREGRNFPKAYRLEANAENAIRLTNMKMQVNRASWYPAFGARYTPKYGIGIFGGKVNVADDVTFRFDAGSDEAHLMVVAAKNYSESNTGMRDASTEQGNDVAFHGTVEADANRDAEVVVAGSAVNLDRAKLRMPRGNLDVIASQSTKGENGDVDGRWREKGTGTATGIATATNVVQADGLEIEGNARGTEIYGGKVELKNAKLHTSSDVSISAYASHDWTYHEGNAGNPASRTTTLTAAPTNTLTLKNTQVTGDRITMFGGKVQMKDSFAEAKSLQIAAAGTLKSMRRGYYAPAYELYPVADVDNTLYLEGTTLKSAANAMGYTGKTSLMGGRVASKDVGIQAAGLEIYAGKMESRDGSIYLTQGTPLHLDGTKIEAPSYRSLSGAANLVNGSEVKGSDVTFVAAQSYDGGTGKATVTKDNTLSLWGSKVEADNLSFMAGGVNAWKASEIKSQNAMDDHAADLVHADGSAFTMQRDETAHISEAGTELGAPRVSIAAAPKEPSSPLLPLTPDNAQLSEQDKENIDRGRSQATDIIASQAGTAAQSKALVEVVATLNETPNASTRQTAGVVGGMLTAIAEASTLTTEEKQALQIAVLDAYGPVQEAKAESDHRTQQAKADADRMTTTENAAAALPTSEEPQEAVHFVG